MEHSVVLGAALLIFACGFVQSLAADSDALAKPSFQVHIKTDKLAYASSEAIGIVVAVDSSGCVGRAAVSVIGIRPSSMAYINETKVATLERGTQQLHFSATAPRCTKGCGGVYPGAYNVTAEVRACGAEASDTITLTLVDG